MESESSNSSHHHPPLPPQDPLCVFPAEVWEKILDKVVHPQDILNCQRSCQLFSDILKCHDETLLLFQVCLPLLDKYLGLPSLLSCRALSSQCKLGVDKYLQTYPLFCPSFPRPLIRPAIDFTFTRRASIKNSVQAVSFYDYLNSHDPSNPFPNRTLHVHRPSLEQPCYVSRKRFGQCECCKPGVWNDEWVQTKIELSPDPSFDAIFHEVSSRSGHNILYLLYSAERSLRISVNQLLRILHHFPNLYHFGLNLDSYRVDRALDDLEELLPPMKNLISLQLLVNCEPLAGILLTTYGHQLERLECPLESLLKVEFYSEIVIPKMLPNVKELKLRRVDASYVPHLQLKQPWPVTTLSIELSSMTEDKAVKSCARILWQFSKSLTWFHLQFGSKSFSKGLDSRVKVPSWLVCPHLRKLGVPLELLEMRKIFFTKLIQMCPNLEEVHVVTHDSQSWILKIYKNSRKEQHLWNLLPARVSKFSVMFCHNIVFKTKRGGTGNPSVCSSKEGKAN